MSGVEAVSIRTGEISVVQITRPTAAVEGQSELCSVTRERRPETRTAEVDHDEWDDGDEGVATGGNPADGFGVRGDVVEGALVRKGGSFNQQANKAAARKGYLRGNQTGRS